MYRKLIVLFLTLALISAACKTFGGPSTDILEVTADPLLVEQVLTQLPNDGEIPQPGIDSVEMQELQSIFANAKPDADGTIRITITDQQLNLAMQTALDKAMNAPDAPAITISNPRLYFISGFVVFEADITKPLEGHLVIEFIPYIAGDSLQYDVLSAKVGEINVPSNLLGVAETAINDTMTQAMSEMPANVTLQDVIIGDGTMTVIGQLAT